MNIFTGKIYNCTPAHQVHPKVEQESIFSTFFAVRGTFGASDSSFRPPFGGDD